MRGVRGRTGATSTDRWFGLAGVKKDEKPAQKIFEINELIDDLPIMCYNGQDTEGAAGFGYVYAVKEGAVTADTVTTVKFDIKKGKTHYMQWYCEGYNYGGEITYMGNAVETTID